MNNNKKTSLILKLYCYSKIMKVFYNVIKWQYKDRN